EDMRTVSEFELREGERVPFVLTWFPSYGHLPEEIDPERALDDTEDFWLDWAGACTHEGDYHDELHQSLLVLKALTYAPTGGIVAAPTTSLPELVGGVRNWDYRFCWLRDAALTLLAMLNAGYRDEAVTWRQWLLRAVAGDPADVQIMYGLAGERRLAEWEVDWLPGFEGSRPVRVGNAASEQLQLDVYGEVLDALYQTRLHGAAPDDDVWSLTRALLDWLEEGWRQPDAGIWEVRGPSRHFTHSKVMAWVAFDRAVRECEEFGRDGPVERWRAVRDEAGVRPVVRLRSPRRERAPHAARRLPARPGRAGRLHGRRHPAGAVRGRAPAPLPQRGGGRRRPAGRRRRLPALLVLARAGARPAGADERGAGAVRAPPRPPQRRRAVGGGVRPGRQAAAR